MKQIDVDVIPQLLTSGQLMDDVRDILEKAGLNFAGIKGKRWGFHSTQVPAKRLPPEKAAFPGRTCTCAVPLGVMTLLPDTPCHFNMASVIFSTACCPVTSDNTPSVKVSVSGIVFSYRYMVKFALRTR